MVASPLAQVTQARNGHNRIGFRGVLFGSADAQHGAAEQ